MDMAGGVVGLLEAKGGMGGWNEVRLVATQKVGQ